MIRSKVLLIMISLLTFSANELIAQRYSLTGILRNGATEELISGAQVTLKDFAFSAVSNESGKFTIDSVFTNTYVLNVKMGGFQSYQAQIQVKDDLNLGVITLFPMGFEDETGAALQKTIRATNITELFNKRPNFIGGNSIYGIPPEPKKLQGNFYLDTKWNKASILLYKDEQLIEGYFVRYNINSNNFELRSENSEDATTVPGLRVRNIVWIDSEHGVPRYFINGMDFKDEGSPIAGFFEVLVDGKLPLVRRTIASIRESNYNQALMVGEPDDRVVKRYVYYYIEGKNVIEIPTNKKKIFTIFGENQAEMEAFAESNKLNLKEASSLFSLFTQYNSKFEGFDPLLPKLIDNQP
ncbi:carboxypeptidase-like regulatory domain-containing protein [Cognataquiflexum rubidum]|uniref:carboxypeptidase-like regulatory domain-containing protein n=1 Tax=Cognataquiflexum rubidum TaxID=2922273 RepID=UPI001F1413A2|nr:carboxypeptidase-like regulatory domain-containing protein [Cognataquiflexum rubidum]MCH6233537.1 carboxypeptidase-like regulatory domain-containing protein [Cognataquiflexum rubidum]